MPRKGENIYKRKDGRWEGRYIRSYDSEHKAKYAYVYGKTYSEVKRKLTEQRGNVQKVQPTKNKSSTYGELLDCWLHSMQLNTKESTQARYTHLIKTHIKPHLGAVQLSQLTTDVIEIFIEQQLTDGRLDNSGGLSPKTVTDILTIIKSTIEYARYKELPVICNLSKLSIKKKEKEMRVFTPSEQESLIGTLTNDMDHSKFGVLLSLYTGIRVGESVYKMRLSYNFPAHAKEFLTESEKEDLELVCQASPMCTVTLPQVCDVGRAVELDAHIFPADSEVALRVVTDSSDTIDVDGCTLYPRAVGTAEIAVYIGDDPYPVAIEVIKVRQRNLITGITLFMEHNKRILVQKHSLCRRPVLPCL